MTPRAVAVAVIAGVLGGFEPANPATGRGQPTFSAEAEMVVLHVTVHDRRGAHVTDLTKDAFRLMEDGAPQEISHFSDEEVPASIGLVIDGSSSMHPHREMVVASTLAFTEQSHVEDELFVLAFSEHVREVWPPRLIGESSQSLLRYTLRAGIGARGMTALHDAITTGLERVAEGRHTRQVLVVVSDGADNASPIGRDEIIDRVRKSNAQVYTIALRDPVSGAGDPGLLRRISDASGGAAFRPRRVPDLADVMPRIARDIHSAYTLGYVSTQTTRDGAFRQVRVLARSPEGRPLSVRTRAGYYAANGS
jgi:Ca-activated chloride channel homolog